MRKLILILLCLFTANALFAQAVKNTSYKTSLGERVLQLEVVLDTDLASAWKLLSTDEGLVKWVAPVAHIELKKNGSIVTNYDKTKPLTDSGSIRLPILAYTKGKMIALKVELNNNFTKSVRDSDDNLKEVITLVKIDATHTKLISAMSGFGTGPDWDKTYEFFVRGNTYTYEELLKHYK
jgi:PPE-repeat protein